MTGSRCDDRFVAREDVLYRKLVDGGLVYDSLSTQVHHLNASAAAVWEACQRGSDLEAIAAEVRTRFEAEEEDVEEQVSAILKQFADVQLLKEAGDGPSH